MGIGLGGGNLLVPPPSKVIAVRLSYASRAAERGWLPPFPSYFLKPPSSLAERGGKVVRPDGCELLAFGGEIALVIGDPARSVRPEDGLDHVAFVTAANDLCVHDLRYADRGSDLRSRGGDGFTPIGPRLLDASRIDLSSLVLRTWLNGRLVQEAATTDELLFPFALLVADLSRLMTLERGDVVLTGTPTGAAVAEPDDLIEVEVTAGFATTGRLATRVVAAEPGSLPAIGAMPRADGEARAAAAGAEPASPITPKRPMSEGGNRDEDRRGGADEDRGGGADEDRGGGADEPEAATEREPGGRPRVDPAVVAALSKVATATLAQQLRRRGLNGVVMTGLTPTRPGAKLVGRARTVRYLPSREDVFADRGAAMNAQRRAVESLEAGEILVIAARGEQGSGTIGDILALRAERRGAVGIVTDGPLRDAAAIRTMGLPVFHRGTSPAQLGRRHVPFDTDVAVDCAGVLVEPGDLLVGDDDGVVVVPVEVAAEVARDAAEQERQERFVAERVAGGASIERFYPLGEAEQKAYQRWLEGQADSGE